MSMISSMGFWNTVSKRDTETQGILELDNNKNIKIYQTKESSNTLQVLKKPEYHKVYSRHKGIWSPKSSMLTN